MSLWGFKNAEEMHAHFVSKVRDRERNLNKAVQDLKWALVAYCEEADFDEARRIDRAWETVLDVLYPEDQELTTD